eukprot:scaffold13537_cov115-Isochrysis_galbana.AAC.2
MRAPWLQSTPRSPSTHPPPTPPYRPRRCGGVTLRQPVLGRGAAGRDQAGLCLLFAEMEGIAPAHATAHSQPRSLDISR